MVGGVCGGAVLSLSVSTLRRDPAGVPAMVVCGWSWSGDTGILIKYNTDTSKTQNIKGDAKNIQLEESCIFRHFLSTRTLL